MRTATRKRFHDDLFSAAEIARAAGVPVRHVTALVASGRVIAFRQFVAPFDAARLVRELSSGQARMPAGRIPLTPLSEEKPKRTPALVVSSLLHGLFVLAILFAVAFGLLQAPDPNQAARDTEPARLVYLMEPGAGGGGGGGGQHATIAASAAKLKAVLPALRRTPSPTPVVIRHAVPHPSPEPVRRVPPVHLEPRLLEAPQAPPTPVVAAPVVRVPADAADAPGVVSSNSALPSPGQGAGGGLGSGAGTGSGPGQGDGIGAGSGGGAGGGPYRPGSGIDPPKVLHEVRPLYTDEARRQSIEGNVVLEIVVQKTGRVGTVRVLRTLGSGLEQKAIDAVRQWQFAPARRLGEAVDVIVQVSVEFTLR